MAWNPDEDSESFAQFSRFHVPGDKYSCYKVFYKKENLDHLDRAVRVLNAVSEIPALRDNAPQIVDVGRKQGWIEVRLCRGIGRLLDEAYRINMSRLNDLEQKLGDLITLAYDHGIAFQIQRDYAQVGAFQRPEDNEYDITLEGWHERRMRDAQSDEEWHSMLSLELYKVRLLFEQARALAEPCQKDRDADRG